VLALIGREVSLITALRWWSSKVLLTRLFLLKGIDESYTGCNARKLMMIDEERKGR
jgi:hypothetical protein